MAALAPTQRLLCLAIAAMLCAAGCSSEPTYKKENLTSDIQGLLLQEGINSSAKLVEKTLAVHIDYPGSLEQGSSPSGFSEAFERAMQKGFTTTHRVLMSSDAQVDFYVVLLTDPNTPGAYLTIVRYFDDLLRANAQMLDTNEFFARSIFEMNYLGPKKTLSLENYVQNNIQLPEFLSWQMARRIQTALSNEFSYSDSVEVGRCQGQFRNGEFAFTLNVASVEPGFLAEEDIQGAFAAATGVVKHVLSGYHFDKFDTVRLIHLPTGRDLVVPKASLLSGR